MIICGPPISEAQRREHIDAAIATSLPFFEPYGHYHDYLMNIVGYGPSIKDTWRQIINKKFGEHEIISTSGAYDFLLDHDIYSDWYVVVDPSQSTLDLLNRPSRGTRFLLATCCHPDWWEKLRGYDVKLFHAAQGDERGPHMIYGGSTVAQRAIHVAAALGYRRFNMFGMDCSFTENRHAGSHSGEIQPVTTVILNDREFKTTPQLIQSAQEMQQELMRGDAEFNFYGDGLMQEIAKMIDKEKSNGRV